MRFAVFVFSILLIFSTTYAHAIAFVPAVVGGLVRTAGGQVMKVASKRGVVATASAALALYCKKNQKKCKDIVGEAVDYFFDDDENCSTTNGIKGSPADICQRWLDAENKRYLFADRVEAKQTSSSAGYCLVYGGKEKYNGALAVNYTCGELDTQREQQKQQQIQKIVKHLSDDDITYIINNYGDQINIDKYCAAPGACAELEQSFGDEVMNNKNKYDIDKINEDNCEVKKGKITSCDKAKKDTDDDDSDTPKEPKKPDDGDDGKDGDNDNDSSSNDKDDNKINCEASAFHKKVCDFIDWYQDDADLKDGDKVEIKELSNELKIDDDKVSFGRVCPAGKTVSISFGNIKIVKQLSYQGLCDAFIKMKPFVIGVGWIVGAMIVVGRRV